MNIRIELASDHPALSALVTEAFRGGVHSCGYEAEIVPRLRAAGALTLSLVATGPDGPIGQVAASPATIDGETGWVGFGPLAVLPAEQRKGVGSALMTKALDMLRPQVARGAVLVGDPNYYRRFGFAAYPELCVAGVPPACVLALPFDGVSPRGAAVFHSAFAPV